MVGLLLALVVLLVTGAAEDLLTSEAADVEDDVFLSVKSKHVQRPRFNGFVVSTFTTLNFVLKSWGPSTGWLEWFIWASHSIELNTATAPLTALSR